MKNALACTLLILAFGFCTPSIFAQKDTFSYIFTVSKDTVCWKKVPDKVFRFKVINRTSCEFTLMLGSASDTLKITGSGFDSLYQLEDGKLKLPREKKLPLPESVFANIQILWGEACETNQGASKIDTCSTGSPKSYVKQPNGGGQLLFIPSSEEEAAFQKMASKSIEGTGCCPGSQELIYDYPAQCLAPVCERANCFCRKCLRHFKEKAKADSCSICNQLFSCSHPSKTLRKFHPRVDDKLRIRVVGMHPYRDSLTLGVAFEDRNKEDKAKFVAMLDKAGKSATPTTGNSENVADEQESISSKTLLISTFRKEMAQFYEDKLEADSLSANFLALCVQHIRENIREHFGTAATPEAMREKANEWIDAMSDLAQKKKSRIELAEGLRNYQRIISYHSTSAWLFQVENADMTKLEFNWFRDGKPVSDKPQAFRFFNKGGFTIDFSTGIAINGLVNHSFTTLATSVIDSIKMDTTIKNRVIRERGSAINLGPVVLAHAYYRYPGWSRFKVGATTGFMANTRDNDFGLNYILGGSLLFGSEQRLVLTGGTVVGKVTRLASWLKSGEEDGTLLDPPKTTGETTKVQTSDVYRCKWFVGVTYNLGK